MKKRQKRKLRSMPVKRPARPKRAAASKRKSPSTRAQDSKRPAPMEMALDYEEVLPGIFRWELYSKAHKVLLTSYAIVKARRLYVIDPIPLAQPARQKLLLQGSPVSIILTNENHARDSVAWRTACRVSILAAAGGRFDVPGVERFTAQQRSWIDWQLHPIPGGTNGELALELKGGSLVIFGDALTNLPGYGLSLLSEKYCLHRPTLRHSLRQLLSRVDFERALFAHGEPLLERASATIERLL